MPYFTIYLYLSLFDDVANKWHRQFDTSQVLISQQWVSKRNTWAHRYIKDKFSKRCLDWSEKYLSGDAKEVLIKSVVQKIPTYARVFSSFRQGCVISQITRKFWWVEETDRRKVHWMAWTKLFDQSLKVAWDLGTRDCLIKLFLRDKPNALSHTLKVCVLGYSKRTITLQAILLILLLVRMLRLVGKGSFMIWKQGFISMCTQERIRIWRDNWIRRRNLKVSSLRGRSRLSELKILYM